MLNFTQIDVDSVCVRYAQKSLENYRKKTRINFLYFYTLNFMVLFFAIVPGIAIAILQVIKINNEISTEASNAFVISITVVSSLTSLFNGLLSFFVVRLKYKQYKKLYHEILAEFLLFNNKTGIYKNCKHPELNLFNKVVKIRSIKDPKEFRQRKYDVYE